MKNIKIKMLIFVYAVLAILGVNAVANAASVTIEGSYLVRNATNNEVNYVKSTNAKVGDTLRVMVWYHNTMNETSGLDAKGLLLKATVPANSGTIHVNNLSVTGSNTNTVSSSNTVITNTNTVLQYVPGTATRKHNIGTNANPNWVVDKVDDSIVGNGYYIPTMKPCYNFEESIVFTVRVAAVQIPDPSCTISIDKNEIEKGDSAILSYTTQNATSASIDNGIGNITVGSGSRNVSPTSDTTYALTASGNGKTVTCSASILVKEKVTPTPTPTPIPTPTPTTPTTIVSTGKGNLPESGPAEAAAGAVGLTATGGAAYAWARSKKALLGAITKIK